MEETGPKSVVERFLKIRGLQPRDLSNGIDQKDASVATKARRLLWQDYTKNKHSIRINLLRTALRIPDDIYVYSVDAYNPIKRPKRFLKVHHEELDINTQFEYRTRRMFFERQVLDKDVCDLIENRMQYHSQLDRIYSVSDGDLLPVELE